MQDLKTQALVLRRTNYGETDRILQVLTPEGKKTVLAKGVRREKSKLAGGIEMFSLSEVVLHEGKGEFAILTSAKMKEFYSELLTDFARLEIASEFLKKIAKAAEATDNAEFFAILHQSLRELNRGGNAEIIQAWFYFNLAKASGEQVNLYFDAEGDKLEEAGRYVWDAMEKVLRPSAKGRISGNEIKMMRLMWSAELSVILRIAGTEKMAGELLDIARSLNLM